MANTYKLIEAITLSSSQATLSFTGLGSYSSIYNDLHFVFSLRGDNADNLRGLYLSLNGSTSNFTDRYLRGYGTGADSGSIARYTGEGPTAASTANTFGSISLYIPNFSSSNHKSYSVDNVTENNAASGFASTVALVAGLWSDTAAITSLSIAYDSGNFVSGSTAYLYGIKNS